MLKKIIARKGCYYLKQIYYELNKSNIYPVANRPVCITIPNVNIRQTYQSTNFCYFADFFGLEIVNMLPAVREHLNHSQIFRYCCSFYEDLNFYFFKEKRKKSVSVRNLSGVLNRIVRLNLYHLMKAFLSF